MDFTWFLILQHIIHILLCKLLLGHNNIDAEETACHNKVYLMAGSLSTKSKYP